MKLIIATLAFLIAGFGSCTKSYAIGLTDLKFGQYQVADSQWDVSACMYTTTCQIYSTNPGTAYKIPWTSGQIQWSAGDYIQFINNSQKDATNPWLAVHYGSNGVAKDNMGTGHIINMGNDFFFFVGNDNDTGQLFSMTKGLSGSNGVTWSGTLNPSIDQVNAYAGTGSTTPLSAGQTASPPPSAQTVSPSGPPTLCCGASAAPFNANPDLASRVITYASRPNNDSKVYVSQIGDYNNISIDQSGTRNNFASYVGNGNDNNINVQQSSTSPAALNYTDIKVGTGQASSSNNVINVQQQSTGGHKGAFINIQDNNNNISLKQQDGGNHWADISVSGGNKTVDITQSGSSAHMATVQLTGPQPAGLNLQQTGSTQQSYSIQSNCTTPGGCGTITVSQGK